MWAKKGGIGRTWMNLNDPIKRTVNTQGLKSVTMYGACSNFTPTLPFMLWKGTTSAGFSYFLRELRQVVQENHVTSKVTLILDNHAAHHSHSVQKHYVGFNVLFLPAYSSFLNS